MLPNAQKTKLIHTPISDGGMLGARYQFSCPRDKSAALRGGHDRLLASNVGSREGCKPDLWWELSVTPGNSRNIQSSTCLQPLDRYGGFQVGKGAIP